MPTRPRVIESRLPLLRRMAKAWRALIGYQGAAQGDHVWRRKRFRDLPPDALLALEGPALRERSRFLFRNWSSARAGVNALVDLVVSTGIDIQPDTGSERVDARLHAMWSEWCERAGTDGQPLWELQRQLFRSEVLEGDGFWHLVWLADTDRTIPLAIHPLSREQLADRPVATMAAGCEFRAGAEVDGFGRVIAWHFADDDPRMMPGGEILLGGNSHLTLPCTSGQPADNLGGARGGRIRGVRIPADEIVHAYEPLHPGQVLGEPWLASVIATIHQEAELVRTELASAKASSAAAFAIVTKALDSAFGLGEAEPADGTADAAPSDGRGNDELLIEPGATFRLGEGEDVKVLSHTRPAQQIAPFRQMLRGDLAAALRIRQQDLDKDYTRANYSSMRAAQLDLRRSIEPVQQRVGSQSTGRLWAASLPLLAVAAGVTPPSNRAAWRRWTRGTLSPDGFPYVNPKEDVESAIGAIRAGLSTWRDELGWRGRDHRAVLRQLTAELRDPLLARIFTAAPNQATPASTENPEPAKETSDAETADAPA